MCLCLVGFGHFHSEVRSAKERIRDLERHRCLVTGPGQVVRETATPGFSFGLDAKSWASYPVRVLVAGGSHEGTLFTHRESVLPPGEETDCYASKSGKTRAFAQRRTTAWPEALSGVCLLAASALILLLGVLACEMMGLVSVACFLRAPRDET